MEKGKIVIVYDGDCIFCSRSMDWIVRHDGRNRIRLTPCTSDTGSMLMLTHGIDPHDPSTFLAIIDGTPYTRSTAMLRLIPHLDRSVRSLAVFGLIPRRVRDIVYDLTARNRRRIVRGACPVPTSEMKRRLLP